MPPLAIVVGISDVRARGVSIFDRRIPIYLVHLYTQRRIFSFDCNGAQLLVLNFV